MLPNILGLSTRGKHWCVCMTLSTILVGKFLPQHWHQFFPVLDWNNVKPDITNRDVIFVQLQDFFLKVCNPSYSLNVCTLTRPNQKKLGKCQILGGKKQWLLHLLWLLFHCRQHEPRIFPVLTLININEKNKKNTPEIICSVFRKLKFLL